MHRELTEWLAHRIGSARTCRGAHVCCGVVRNVCCDVSAVREAAFKLSPAPPLLPKLGHRLHELKVAPG
jgi:hypothetical protein